MRLTDITLRRLPVPSKGQRIYFDDTLRSFGCRISQGGTRTFVVQHGFDRQLITIGRYPLVSLSDARTEAKRLLAERVLSRRRPTSIGWDQACMVYLAECQQRNKPSTVRDYRRLLAVHFPYRSRVLTDIAPEDVSRRLDRLRETPAERNHALTAVKVFFNWAIAKHYLDVNPCARMSTFPQPARERVLNNNELAAVYNAALSGTHAFSQIITLLILTGQRRGEIGSLQWSWIDERQRTITIPGRVTKNKRTHVFPYGDTTAVVLAGMFRTTEHLFPASREHVRGEPTTSFNGWMKAKAAFDIRTGVKDYQIHDLRRTFATGLAALGTPVHVTERLLNHVSGTYAGIVGVYQRHSYMDEMRTAVAKWDQWLTSLLPELDNGRDGDNPSAPLPSPATLSLCQPRTDIVRQSPTVSDIVGHRPT